MGHPAHTDAAHRHPLPVWGKILIIIAVFLLVLILSIAITIHALLSKIDRPSVDQQYATESELEEIDLRDAVRENQNAKTVYPTLNPEDIRWSPAAEAIDTLRQMAVTVCPYFAVAPQEPEGTDLVTEADVLAAAQTESKTSRCRSGAIITPAARDALAATDVILRYEGETTHAAS